MTPEFSKSKLFDLIGYTPHSAAQWNAHHSTHRFRIPCCGRRWGKSTFAAREMTAALMDITKPESYYWIVGPSYSLGEKEFRIVYYDIFKRLGLAGTKGMKFSYNAKQGDMTIKMPWDTVLEVKSAQLPDSLIGEGLDGLVMSEAAVHSRDTWEMYLEPALSDKRGWAIFPSTPRGYNWYFGLWMMGQDPEFIEYESWRFPTWTNLAMYPGGRDDPEIQRVERTSSRSHFAQEYAAEFTAFEGQIYDEWEPDVHIIDFDYNPAWQWYWALDFGFKDPFVCLDIGVDAEQNVYVWREYQVSGYSTWEHCITLKNRDYPQGYHREGIYADPRGADAIATVEMHFGHVVSMDVGWQVGVEEIKRLLKIQPDGLPKMFFNRNGCPITIRQMEQLRHKEVKEGQNVRREGQHDYNDHGPDALRYFVGPYFAAGANSHLSDVYGSGRTLTEGETFFQLHKGFVRSELSR